MNKQMLTILNVLNARQKGMISKEIGETLTLQGSELSPPETPMEGGSPLSRFASGLGDNPCLTEGELRSDYWSVFEGLKHSSL